MVQIDSNTLAIIALAISFFSALFLTRYWIRAARRFGLVGRDLNKYNKRIVAEGGGIAVVSAFIAGMLTYIFMKTFIIKSSTHLLLMFAVLVTILFASFLGFVDDILGWRKGLKQWVKPLFTIPIAIPLMVLNVGHSVMHLPLIGTVDFGVVYPLLLVPIGIVGATNGFNMLAGLNGLEASMGVIILSTLGIIAWQTGFSWLTLIAFCMAAALLGFLFFNKIPAKVFPGDALTYSVGALIAVLAILGDMEKVAVILFIPYFLEFIAKARHRFKSECFGVPLKNGGLKAPEQIGSLIHIMLRIKGINSEQKAKWAILSIEIILAIIVLIWLAYG